LSKNKHFRSPNNIIVVERLEQAIATWMEKQFGGSNGNQFIKPCDCLFTSRNFEVFAWFVVAIHIEYMPRADETTVTA
jgi:hypothetical protein